MFCQVSRVVDLFNGGCVVCVPLLHWGFTNRQLIRIEWAANDNKPGSHCVCVVLFAMFTALKSLLISLVFCSL